MHLDGPVILLLCNWKVIIFLVLLTSIKLRIELAQKMFLVHIFSFFIAFLALGQCGRLEEDSDEIWIWGEDSLDNRNPLDSFSIPQSTSQSIPQSTSQSISQSTAQTTQNPSSAPTPRTCPGCPVTPQFHPVCGSDRATYDNPAAVECANTCGPRIEILFYAACQRTIGLVLPNDE